MGEVENNRGSLAATRRRVTASRPVGQSRPSQRCHAGPLSVTLMLAEAKKSVHHVAQPSLGVR
jgi:hypothetical protein